MRVGPGTAFQIAKDPLFEVDVRRAGELAPVEKSVRAGAVVFPPASVTALELPIVPR
jgi:hypothetical protein